MKRQIAMWIAGRVAKSYQLQLSRPLRGRFIGKSRIVGMRSGFNAGVSTGIGVGLALGGAVMYMLDPDRGKRRRILVQGRIVRAARTSGEALSARSKDLRTRTQGALAGIRSRIRPVEATGDGQ